ncbi:hypothetical protein FPZ41_40000 [Streptomyces sp. K1PN6]|uniref:Uncharacterized protein n=1 Tax=Streptomyces acidicola TaxID=2596892 RepID=A0A5N8X5N5_9ACTN|nr:hypothetical protein [Streptomyces acidicola]
MTPTSSTTGRHRHLPVLPPPGPSVSRRPALPQDPPIYSALMRIWADRGRTLPGHRDPEWIRLAAPPSGPAQFTRLGDPFGSGPPFGVTRDPLSATRDPRGDGR